jgi:hypothetical protein
LSCSASVLNSDVQLVVVPELSCAIQHLNGVQIAQDNSAMTSYNYLKKKI